MKRPENYDHPLRYHVASRRNGVEPYLVELNAHGGNGCCQCEDFACRMEPLLSRGLSPKQAVQGELIALPDGRDPRDALRCHHIVEARRAFADDLIAAIMEREGGK